MADWHFADGSGLHSGGLVTGKGAASHELLERLSVGTKVHLFPQPSEPVPLVPSSDYMLNALALEVAQYMGVAVTTSYEPDEDDAPPEITRQLAEARRLAQYIPYGAVH